MSGYDIGLHLGRGGMADVYFGVQRGIGGFAKLVVLKRMLPKFAESQDFVQLLVEEARLAAAIQHPNIVEVYDVRSSPDLGVFIAMEHLLGLTLEEVLDSDIEIPVPIALRIAADIAEGLRAAHTATDANGETHPIVHLDVTPSNIMVCATGEAKLLDFGIALASDANIGIIRGKPGYIPPEQMLGARPDPRSDVFQLGLTLFEMITGRRTFSAASTTGMHKAVATAEIARPSSLNASVGTELDQVILKATERDLDLRFQNANELKRQLQTLLKSRGNVGRDQVATWLSETFKEPLEAKRLQVSKARKDLLSENRPPNRFAVGTDLSRTEAPTMLDRPTPAPELMVEMSKRNGRQDLAKKGRRRWGLAAALVLLLGILGGVLLFARAGNEAPEAGANTSANQIQGAQSPSLKTSNRTEPDALVNELAPFPARKKPSDNISAVDAGPVLPTPRLSTLAPKEVEVTNTKSKVPKEPKKKTQKSQFAPKTDLRDPWSN